MSAIDFYGNEPGNSKSVVFLCSSSFGRFLYNLTLFLQIPKIIGAFLRSPLSKFFIKGFIKKNNIDMSAFAGVKFKSFNDFFTRKDNSRKSELSPETLISPCDSALSVFNIEENSTFKIKGFDYALKDFFETDEFDKTFSDGNALIFRLAATDYHRYCYIDSGSLEKNHFLKGKLYSVQPVCCRTFKVYIKNRRSWTILHTQNFGDVAQVEVGAFSVGGIKNHHENYTFSKGEEKGYFDLHGSTIVMLFRKNTIKLDEEILAQTANGKEITVKYGQPIGKKA
ncbi:phosphatidylserine decarboxylase [uncultured Treponema sp.]|uniref:phosphatidylserine decarboxylase n=1 Tax=uncultured Treponema sp. TaxID=162155 RepID=UPI0025EF0ACF|nr:phosphatidylserine decarboxylase [uncultured Treponema sp.]